MRQRSLTVFICILLRGIVAPQEVNSQTLQRSSPDNAAVTPAAAAPRPASLRLAGEQNVLHSILANWAGAWQHRLHTAADGSVIFDVTASEVASEPSARLLFDFVNGPELIVFYAGTDGAAVANLFIRECRLYPPEKIARTFNGHGYVWGGGHISGIEGRRGVPQPANEVFAVIAFHTSATVQQIAVSQHFSTVATAAQHAGVGKDVPLAALYLHEVAEVLAFAEQRRRGQALNYREAHAAAIEREAEIRGQRKMDGGFAGGMLRFAVPNAARVQAWQSMDSDSPLNTFGSVLAKLFWGRSDGKSYRSPCKQAAK